MSEGAAKLAGQVQSAASDLADGAKTQMDDMAGKATVAAQDAYGHVRDQVRDAGTVVARSVEQQPLMALLVGGLICGVAGYLLARR
ncbi:MAG TPA: hypothetical protein VL614_10025 [Acetobacteraceae bacterium]|nr:hypothetical protein [Acetobacteraceae bacterium]